MTSTLTSVHIKHILLILLKLFLGESYLIGYQLYRQLNMQKMCTYCSAYVENNKVYNNKWIFVGVNMGLFFQ